MGFAKFVDFSHLSDAEKKALKKLLENQKKDLQDALKSLSAKKKAKKSTKGKKAKR
jgi:succinate dehydrogenase flavin-adding protein (antitoxin of CptAB toxin-antitoxin module)